MKPFRWDISRREQLGRLIEGPQSAAYVGFGDDLRNLAAAVISAAGDADLVFIGRSPETIFDYLSGVLLDTTWSNRLHLLNLSIRGASLADIRRDHPAALAAVQEHLSDLALSPTDLVQRAYPLALIDLVSTGTTFRNVTELYLQLATEASLDLSAIRRKLHYVGITWRTKNSPNTYRWHQSATWLDAFPKRAVKNVSISGRMWAYLGNDQEKVTPTNPPWRWADSKLTKPPRESAHLEALRRAVSVFDQGVDPQERHLFSAALASQHAMRYRWCRSLVAELRQNQA